MAHADRATSAAPPSSSSTDWPPGLVWIKGRGIVTGHHYVEALPFRVLVGEIFARPWRALLRR